MGSRALHDRLEPAEPHRDQLPNTGLSIRPFVDHREPLCLVRAQRQNASGRVRSANHLTTKSRLRFVEIDGHRAGVFCRSRWVAARFGERASSP
jgi:hypothetical protein